MTILYKEPQPSAWTPPSEKIIDLSDHAIVESRCCIDCGVNTAPGCTPRISQAKTKRLHQSHIQQPRLSAHRTASQPTGILMMSRAGDIYNAVAQAAELASALGTQGEVTPGQMEILFMAAASAVCPTVREQEVKAAARVVLKEFEIAMAGTCDTANQVTHGK